MRFSLLPDRARRGAGASTSGTPLGRPQLERDRELQELLHYRLRIAFTLLSVLLTFYALSFHGQVLGRYRLGLFALLPLAIAPTILIWRKRDLSLAALRWFELIFVGYGYVTVIFLCHLRLSDLESLTQGAPKFRSQHDHNARLLLFPDGSLFTGFSETVVCNPVIILWGLFAVGYSFLIPTTFRRAATVMVFATVAALALIASVAVRHPAFRPNLVTALSYTGFIVAAFGAIGVYGSHRLDRLRSQVIAAQQIGQYFLRRQLGKGGMGEVYLAQHRMLQRPCAIKLIRMEKKGDAQSLLRFEREVQAMAQLTHANTVEIYDYGRTDDGMFYYAMEYLPGLSVEELVKQHGALHPARTIHLLRQICGALAEAHDSGMIHRDIKPANIFICERGGVQDVVKLLDFGLVQVTGEITPPRADGRKSSTEKGTDTLSGDVRLTNAGHIVGTPAYLSPEQARGDVLDARSDIYSLGAVAYYLLSGQPPFLRATITETLAAHELEAPRPLSERSADIDADLAAVVMRCLEKQPERRYQRVQDLERDLNVCHSAHKWNADSARAWWQGRAITPKDEMQDIDASARSVNSTLLTVDAVETKEVI